MPVPASRRWRAAACAGLVAVLASLPCAVLAAPQVMPNERIAVGNVSRSYRLVVPSAASRDRKLPLVIAFHGLGDTKDRFAGFSRLEQTAEANGFVLAVPDALAFFWPVTLDLARHDLAFFDALYAALTLTYNIDPARVYLVGYSNGAYFAHLLAMARSERVAAIAVHSGGMPLIQGVPHDAERKYGVFAVHGAADPIVPVSESRHVRDVYVAAGHRVEYLELPGHDHRWAGHADVNARIWKFLSENVLR